MKEKSPETVNNIGQKTQILLILQVLPGDHSGTVSCPVVCTFCTNQEHASVLSAIWFSPEMSVLFTGRQKLILTTTQEMCMRGVICWSSCPSLECGWFCYLCLWPSPSRGWSWGSPEEAVLVQEGRRWKRHFWNFLETSSGKVGTQVTILPAVIFT